MTTRREFLRHGSLWLAATAVALYGLDEAADRATWHRRLFPGFRNDPLPDELPEIEFQRGTEIQLLVDSPYLSGIFSPGDWVAVIPPSEKSSPRVIRRIISVSNESITFGHTSAAKPVW